MIRLTKRASEGWEFEKQFPPSHEMPVAHRLRDAERRTIVVGVRLTADEHDRLKASAEGASVKLARFVRDAALHVQAAGLEFRPPEPVPIEAEAQAAERRELRRIGANLNQGIKRLHQLRNGLQLPPVAADLLDALVELRLVVAKIAGLTHRGRR